MGRITDGNRSMIRRFNTSLIPSLSVLGKLSRGNRLSLMEGNETPTVEQVYNTNLAHLISYGTARTSVVKIDIAEWEMGLAPTVEQVYNRNSFSFVPRRTSAFSIP
jgi:hypothetical protein